MGEGGPPNGEGCGEGGGALAIIGPAGRVAGGCAMPEGIAPNGLEGCTVAGRGGTPAPAPEPSAEPSEDASGVGCGCAIDVGMAPKGEEGGAAEPAPASLLDFLEAHVERLTEELAEARTEMRGVRYEAEDLRMEAGRAQVLAALVEAERARSAEIRAERDKLAIELAEQRRPWVARMLRAVFYRQPARRRRRAF